MPSRQRRRRPTTTPPRPRRNGEGTGGDGTPLRPGGRGGAAVTGTKPTPTGRRRSSIPVIEIARAATKDDALAGLDRWRARWPKAAAALEPADVLVDGCAAARRRGTASGSISPTLPRRTARPRKRSTRTTTPGPGTSGRTDRPAERPRRRARLIRARAQAVARPRQRAMRHDQGVGVAQQDHESDDECDPDRPSCPCCRDAWPRRPREYRPGRS